MIYQVLGLIFILSHSPTSTVDDQEIDAVLAQTIDRQEQALQSQRANPYPSEGLWRHEDFALAAYWLNEQMTVADDELTACVTNGLYQNSMNDNWFHWHAYLQERIYFLFSSQSDFFPGRMSTTAENAILEMLWNWAAPSCRIEMASPETVNWVWGSENHHAQAWVGFWGAAHIFKDHPDYQNLTYADGSTPAEMAVAFDEYFKVYAQECATKGLAVEMGSPSYAKYTVNTWYNLADFSEDPVLKESMSMLLDLYWADWAAEQINGVRGGSRHRCYPGNSSMTRSGGDEAAWYHFGLGIAESKHPGVMCAASALWRPSRATVGLALDVEGRGSYEYVTRRLGLKETGSITNFVQDVNNPFYVASGVYRLNPDGGALLRTTWCSPDFLMGTSQVDLLTQADWTKISSQNHWNGVIFGGNNTARIFTQPDTPASGSVYNAEWGVQKKGVQILQRLHESNATGQRVWFDASLTRVETNGWIFARAPQAYAAVRVVSGGGSWEIDPDYPAQGEWLVLTNEFSPVIIEVVSTNDVIGFSGFQSDVMGNDLQVTSQRVDYSSSFYGTTLTLFSDQNDVPLVDGVPLDFSPVRAYDSPYIQGDFGGNFVFITYANHESVVAMTSTVVAVDFGAEYTTASINASASPSTSTRDADFDGTLDDRVTTIAFGTHYSPTDSANWVTPSGKSGAEIKYGISVANMNTTADPSISLNRIDNTLNRLQASSGIGTSAMRMASAWYWEKPSFLNGANAAANLTFLSMLNTLSSYFYSSAGAYASFLVESDGGWYISDPLSVASGRKSINAATANWYVFDPAPDTLFWDDNAKGQAVLGTIFTDVTAVGIYLQHELFDGTIVNAALQAFSSFQATVHP